MALAAAAMSDVATSSICTTAYQLLRLWQRHPLQEQTVELELAAGVNGAHRAGAYHVAVGRRHFHLNSSTVSQIGVPSRQNPVIFKRSNQLVRSKAGDKVASKGHQADGL